MLTKLVLLELSSSNVKKFPEVSFPFLEKLLLSRNQLTLAPFASNVCSTPRLRVLDVSHNQIRKVTPLFFHTLTALTILRMAHNQLSALCDEIECLSSLVELNVSNNAIYNKLPDSITHLQDLAILELHDNALTELPARLTSLSQWTRSIDEWSLKGNQLTVMPPYHTLPNLWFLLFSIYICF